MSLLEKLLRRQNSTNKCSNTGFKSYLSSSRNAEGRFVLDKSEVRLVIFKDHDKFGRKLLYDSHRVDGKEASDKQLLGELLFGNKVMVKKVNSAIKVHNLKDPPQFFVAKVFIPSISSSSESDCQRNCGSFDWYCFHDLPQNDLLASSTSLPVPLRDDLNKSYDASNVGSEPSYKASLTTWLTLKNRDSETSLISSLAITNHDKQDREVADSSLTQSLPLNQRPVKLGIGIIFLIPENDFAAEFMRKFVFSHISILECYILKIKCVLETPEFLTNLKLCRRDKIHSFFQESTQGIIYNLLNFYSSPRIQNPVWLSLSLPSASSSLVGSNFMKEFVFLSDKCYTRNTKFFLGSLLTAVLTHHLSWVVPMSSTSVPNESFLSKTTYPEGHPLMNPLISQFRDLYGAVGFPCCISKTVVVGKRVDLVKKFLFVLSYFIRCNDLFEILENGEDLVVGKMSILSCAADSELSKDSGFSEIETDYVIHSPDSLTNFAATFQSKSKNKMSCETEPFSQCSSLIIPSMNNPKITNKVERKTVTCDLRCNLSSIPNGGIDSEIVKTENYKNEEFVSILPTPFNLASQSKKNPSQMSLMSRWTCEKAAGLTVQKEESCLQKEGCESKSRWDGCCIPHKFDLDELLFEIMEEMFEGKEEDHGCDPCTLKEKHVVNSISLGSAVYSQKFDGDRHENCSETNICTLNVNEPTCLPDGPIKDQLLFKIDLIGTATAMDAISDPEVYASDSDMRHPTILKLANIPLSSFGDSERQSRVLLEDSNSGRSLLGGFCRNFAPDFVLHGTSDRSFLSPPYVDLHRDLKASLKNSILKEPADAALFIVADTDNWSVQLFSLKSISPEEALLPHPIISSQLVLRLIESTSELSKFSSSFEIWLNLIEDQLNNIYMKSRILAEFIQIHGQLCSQQLARLLGYDVSDLPLLLAVAGIHSPRILPCLAAPQRNF